MEHRLLVFKAYKVLQLRWMNSIYLDGYYIIRKHFTHSIEYIQFWGLFSGPGNRSWTSASNSPEARGSYCVTKMDACNTASSGETGRQVLPMLWFATQLGAFMISWLNFGKNVLICSKWSFLEAIDKQLFLAAKSMEKLG